MFDTLILPRWVLPIAPANVILEDYGVIVDGGRIIAVLPTTEALTKPVKKIINLRNHALMPGLVNTHTHSPMNLLRGLADDLPLMEWLEKHIWPAEAKMMNESAIIKGSMLALSEMLRSGVTCFNDHYFFPHVTAECAVKLGIRACLGLLIMNVPTQWATTEAEYFKKAQEIYRSFGKMHPLITWAIGPQSDYSVSDEQFQHIIQWAEKTDLPIHIHMHESLGDIALSMQRYGKRPLQRLDELGLFRHHVVAAHMVHLTESELAWLPKQRIHVAHCPQANLKLANGFAPVKALMANGVNVALGTDGAASNNDLDMIAEMQTAALIAKGVTGDATALKAADALKMATLNGARALKLDKEIGSIEVGKAADLIAVDFGDEMCQPVLNVMSQLVYATGRHQVSDVWVAGQHLVRNHRLLPPMK